MLVYFFSEARHYFYPNGLRPLDLEVNKRMCCPHFGLDDLCVEVKQNIEINTQGLRVFWKLVYAAFFKVMLRICRTAVSSKLELMWREVLKKNQNILKEKNFKRIQV